MKLNFKAKTKIIDGKTVMIAHTGEIVTFKDILKDLHVEKGECLPILIWFSDEKIDDAKFDEAYAEHILELKGKYPDGYFTTEDGEKVKILGLGNK